jgi:protein-S-isoprenylcysteine O-methyltransferase Ste14
MELAAAGDRLRDEDMPALFGAADATSLAGQRDFLRATKVRLGALLVAGLCGVFVGLIEPPDWAALAGVTAFVVAIVVELYLLFTKPERTWYEGRAAAESVKTLAWRYAVGGRPFAVAEVDADKRFLSRLNEILTDLPDVSLVAGPEGGEQVTPAMRNLRAKPPVERRVAYRVGRIEDQRDWYRRKAKWNDERARRLRIVALVLEGVGILAGIVTVVGVVTADLLGIVAAAIAVVAAWMQTKQHETLARAYSVTTQELAAVRSDWEADRSEVEWAAFVDEAEEAISREHTLWRASRGVEARWERG